MVPKFTADFYPENTITTGVYPFWAIDRPESKAFAKKIHAKFGVYPTYAVTAYSWVKLMAKTIEKVGALDTEKVVDALEGAIMETPVGPVEIRACDHHAMFPTYVGRFGHVPEWNFYGPKDLVTLGAENYRSCEEVLKLRKKK